MTKNEQWFIDEHKDIIESLSVQEDPEVVEDCWAKLDPGMAERQRVGLERIEQEQSLILLRNEDDTREDLLRKEMANMSGDNAVFNVTVAYKVEQEPTRHVTQVATAARPSEAAEIILGFYAHQGIKATLVSVEEVT